MMLSTQEAKSNPLKRSMSSSDEETEVEDEQNYSKEAESEDDRVKSGSSDKREFHELDRLRREKRLAMNRESARARRKKKKFMHETLKTRLDEMSCQNEKLRLSIDTLRATASHLESKLAAAKSTIERLTREASGRSCGKSDTSRLSSHALPAPSQHVAIHSLLQGKTSIFPQLGGSQGTLESLLQRDRSMLNHRTADDPRALQVLLALASQYSRSPS